MSNELTDSKSVAGNEYADTPWLDPSLSPFVQIRGLTKRYGDVTAVDGVDLDIYAGELFSILVMARRLSNPPI